MGMIKKQRGVVLIISLVFLVSLTSVATALMLNTTTDIKMSGASEEKLIATQEAISAVDETVSDQITSGVNLFTEKNFPINVNSVGSVQVDSAVITTRNPDSRLVPCSHSRLASSIDQIQCNLLILTVDNSYGRKATSNVNVEAGITQQIFTPAGN